MPQPRDLGRLRGEPVRLRDRHHVVDHADDAHATAAGSVDGRTMARHRKGSAQREQHVAAGEWDTGWRARGGSRLIGGAGRGEGGPAPPRREADSAAGVADELPSCGTECDPRVSQRLAVNAGAVDQFTATLTPGASLGGRLLRRVLRRGRRWLDRRFVVPSRHLQPGAHDANRLGEPLLRHRLEARGFGGRVHEPQRETEAVEAVENAGGRPLDPAEV